VDDVAGRTGPHSIVLTDVDGAPGGGTIVDMATHVVGVVGASVDLGGDVGGQVGEHGASDPEAVVDPGTDPPRAVVVPPAPRSVVALVPHAAANSSAPTTITVRAPERLLVMRCRTGLLAMTSSLVSFDAVIIAGPAIIPAARSRR
jgi:hypothetical protein